MNLKITLSISALLAVVGSTAYYLYNKPHRDIARTTTDHIISSQNLVAYYTQDESTANGNFLGKVIEVNGNMLSIERSNTSEVVIELEGNGESVVRCVLSRKQETSEANYRQGMIITIKGFCIGMLQDVNMRDCILLNKTER